MKQKQRPNRIRMRAHPGHTTGDLAKRFNVHPDTIRYWEREGRIPRATRVGVKQIRYWTDEEAAQIEARLR